MDWLDRRSDVIVVITWRKARPASYLLHNLLQQHVRRMTLAGKDVGTVNLEELKMEKDKHAKRALKRLRKVMSSREQLFLVADEAGPDRYVTRSPGSDVCLYAHTCILLASSDTRIAYSSLVLKSLKQIFLQTFLLQETI